jgi:hypothetical protein
MLSTKYFVSFNDLGEAKVKYRNGNRGWLTQGELTEFDTNQIEDLGYLQEMGERLKENMLNVRPNTVLRDMTQEYTTVTPMYYTNPEEEIMKRQKAGEPAGSQNKRKRATDDVEGRDAKRRDTREARNNLKRKRKTKIKAPNQRRRLNEDLQ